MTKAGAYICHIFGTLFGYETRTYCKEWDEKLNKYLDEGEILYRKGSCINLSLNNNIIEVMCINSLSFDGLLTKVNNEDPIVFGRERPSISTIIKLNKLVDDYDSNYKKEKFAEVISKL